MQCELPTRGRAREIGTDGPARVAREAEGGQSSAGGPDDDSSPAHSPLSTMSW